jgi:hypothetical protein
VETFIRNPHLDETCWFWTEAMFYEDEDTDVETGPEPKRRTQRKKYALETWFIFLVSVNDLRNRTVRIDNVWLGTFTTILRYEHRGLRRCVLQLVCGEVKTGRYQDQELSQDSGKSFTTDGVVLNMTYYNPLLVATSEERS